MTTEQKEMLGTIRRNWARFMAGDVMTEAEFVSRPNEEQESFFKWFCRQCSWLW